MRNEVEQREGWGIEVAKVVDLDVRSSTMNEGYSWKTNTKSNAIIIERDLPDQIYAIVLGGPQLIRGTLLIEPSGRC